MLNLKDLLNYESVVIQCHDNPDPDALACAFAAGRYLSENGVSSEIVYSGFAPLSKANLLLMTDALKIDLRFVGKDEQLPDARPGSLLLTVDCQHGAGNVKALPADSVAIIDHHIMEVSEPRLCDVRHYLGSCSTLMWLLLREEGFDFERNLDVATALYYGLYTDTNAFSEIVHPLDMDMRDSLKYDPGLIKRLRNSNLTISDLTIAGKTLLSYHLDPKNRSAVFEADPCDPNILGFTGDLALQVDSIDACVVFCNVSGGAKISVRSCVREIMANELAQRLCESVGSGGGHREKAGGFISGDALSRLGAASPMDFLRERFSEYYEGYDLVYSDSFVVNPSEMERYKKLNTPVGFVKTSDVVAAGTELVIRTLEGDTYVTAGPDAYVIVGVRQEVYPIMRTKFEASYRPLEGAYKPDDRFLPEERYAPTFKDRIAGESFDLGPYIRPCAPTGEVSILTKRLEKRTKVFTAWNLDGYMFGDVGDYLAARDDDSNDVYVIEKEIFDLTYVKV